MTSLLSRRPWRTVSPVSMYWRRCRQLTVATAAPLRIVERRTSPFTRVSVHRHFHRSSHSRLVFSALYSTVSSSTTHVAAPQRGVTERILVKRMLEARPLDAATGTPSPTSMTARPATLRPESHRSQALVAVQGTDERRRPAMRQSRLHRSHTFETHHFTTSRTRHETTRVSRTSQVRDTRWRQGLNVVRLEWRKTPQSPTSRADGIVVAAGGAARPTQTRTTVETGASTPASKTHAARRDSTAPMLSMDRPTLDRLADTVMQRIERHVRIERERRGL